MSRLMKMVCTLHNLNFGFDDDRVRALGAEPALMRCPMCARQDAAELRAQLAEVTKHRDLVLQVIDLKKTLLPRGVES